MYLFLVTVADGHGLSFYADGTVSRLLPLEIPAVVRARRELIAAGLIVYQAPLYQVLALDPPAADGPRRAFSRPMKIGQILRAMERSE